MGDAVTIPGGRDWLAWRPADQPKRDCPECVKLAKQLAAAIEELERFRADERQRDYWSNDRR